MKKVLKKISPFYVIQQYQKKTARSKMYTLFFVLSVNRL